VSSIVIVMMMMMMMVVVTVVTMMMASCGFFYLVEMAGNWRCKSTCGSEEDNSGGGGRCETHIDIQPVNEQVKKVFKKGG